MIPRSRRSLVFVLNRLLLLATLLLVTTSAPSPTLLPTGQPTRQPSMQPTCQPSMQPTGQPSRLPTGQPSLRPTRQPTSRPSRIPTCQPTSRPSRQPSSQPSVQPTSQPTRQPSRQPVSTPSGQPSAQPSSHPSMQPSSHPSMQPSRQPTARPTRRPSGQPTSRPSSQPASRPTAQPSSQPSMRPSRQPTRQPTAQPTRQPTGQPTKKPTGQPTGKPTRQADGGAIAHFTRVPTGQPSRQPSQQPTNQPTKWPSAQPSGRPTRASNGGRVSGFTRLPTGQPTMRPSRQPSGQPSPQPTGQPSGQPTRQPSQKPSSQPTGQPSRIPTMQPTSLPSGQPSIQPTQRPTAQPTRQPSRQPSRQPTQQPTRQPTRRPSGQPSRQPSSQPSRQPSRSPTSIPSVQPTTKPSIPTGQPSAQPSQKPTSQPTGKPSLAPCPPGYWGNGLGVCKACAVGRYKASSGGSISNPLTLSGGCNACPLGTTTPTTASDTLSDCSLCIAGYYFAPTAAPSAMPSQTPVPTTATSLPSAAVPPTNLTPSPTPRPTKLPVSVVCLGCPVNTYTTHSFNLAVCDDCPNGQVTPPTLPSANTGCINVVPDYTYLPSAAVRVGHSVPSLEYNSKSFFATVPRDSTQSNASLGLDSGNPLFHPQDFNSYFTFYWTDRPLPLLILLFGWFSVLLLGLLLVLRQFIPELRLAPTLDDLDDFPMKIIKRRRLAQFSFWLTLLFALGALHLLWFGYVDLEAGAEQMNAGLDRIGATLTSAQTHQSTLIQQLAAVSCVGGITPALATMKSALGTLAKYLAAGQVEVAVARNNLLGNYASIYKPFMLGLVYASGCIIVASLGVVSLRRSIKGTRRVLLATGVWFFGMTGCVVVEMMLVMAAGDFCVNPLTFVSGLTGSVRVRALLQYYTQCFPTAQSPMQASLRAIDDSILLIWTALDGNTNSGVSSSCSGGVGGIQKVYAALTLARASKLAIENLTSGCAPLYSPLKQFLVDGVCASFFTGFMKSWILHFIINGLVFFATVLTAIICEFYAGPAWTITPRSVHAEKEREEERVRKGHGAILEIVPAHIAPDLPAVPTRIGVNPGLQALDYRPFKNPEDNFSRSQWNRIEEKDSDAWYT